MLKIKIFRKIDKNESLSANLQPKDALQYIKKSSWMPSQDGKLWRHKSAPGTISWTKLSTDTLECVIDGGTDDDDWELLRALTGYLFRYKLRDSIGSISFEDED